MRQWADRECVDNCSNADGPSQQPPDRQDAYLYRGPHQPNGMTSRRQTGHQAVARPRSEPRSDVETGSHSVEHDTADKTNDLPQIISKDFRLPLMNDIYRELPAPNHATEW